MSGIVQLFWPLTVATAPQIAGMARFDAKLSMPKELGDAGGDGSNPEQLLAALGAPAIWPQLLRLALAPVLNGRGKVDAMPMTKGIGSRC